VASELNLAVQRQFLGQNIAWVFVEPEKGFLFTGGIVFSH
jgi:hypothetical protein